jgi:hypothetical protein
MMGNSTPKERERERCTRPVDDAVFLLPSLAPFSCVAGGVKDPRLQLVVWPKTVGLKGNNIMNNDDDR